jgi:very-short-patch-repair endonuclease
MVGCVSEMEAICSVDSALHLGLVTLEQVSRHLSQRGRKVLRHCLASAESGVESIFRVRAARAGFRFRTQAELAGGRVDFVFGERLLVEVDGSAHHSGHEEFVRDRERDALHKALGYVVVRFSYEQVVHRWHEVESVLTLIVARGEHFWPPRIRKSARHAV